MVGFIDPVGTIFQSAMADLNEVAINTATRTEYPHPFQISISCFFRVIFICISFVEKLFGACPEIGNFVRYQGFRKILPQAPEGSAPGVHIIDIPRKKFSYNADIGQIGHLWISTF
jgi:hypothetical protein